MPIIRGGKEYWSREEVEEKARQEQSARIGAAMGMLKATLDELDDARQKHPDGKIDMMFLFRLMILREAREKLEAWITESSAIELPEEP
jgi:hypothetical protein